MGNFEVQREPNKNAAELARADKKLGEYLRRKRESLGLTQSDVAQKLGYGSPQFISNIERGISNVPVKSLRVLIDLYQISADEVIGILLEDKKRALLRQLGLLDENDKGADAQQDVPSTSEEGPQSSVG